MLELGFLSLVRFSVINQVETEIAGSHKHREQVILSKLLYLLHSGGHLKEGARAESTAGWGGHTCSVCPLPIAVWSVHLVYIRRDSEPKSFPEI